MSGETGRYRIVERRVRTDRTVDSNKPDSVMSDTGEEMWLFIDTAVAEDKM
jgi:hypothetical protein